VSHLLEVRTGPVALPQALYEDLLRHLWQLHPVGLKVTPAQLLVQQQQQQHAHTFNMNARENTGCT
jgi:hypothetical protein